MTTNHSSEHVFEVVHFVSAWSYRSVYRRAWLDGRVTGGARKGCSGTVDNLLIDRVVTLDCQRILGRS